MTPSSKNVDLGQSVLEAISMASKCQPKSSAATSAAAERPLETNADCVMSYSYQHYHNLPPAYMLHVMVKYGKIGVGFSSCSLQAILILSPRFVIFAGTDAATL